MTSYLPCVTCIPLLDVISCVVIQAFPLDLAATELCIVQNTINVYNPTFEFYNYNPHSVFFVCFFFSEFKRPFIYFD